MGGTPSPRSSHIEGVGRRVELELVRVLLAEAMHAVDLLQSFLHCLAAADCCGDIYRPELRRQAALLAAREIGMKVLVAQFRDLYVPLRFAEVELR